MKKVLALILGLLMLFAFTACSGGEEAVSDASEAPAGDAEAVEESAEAPEEDAEVSEDADAAEEENFEVVYITKTRSQAFSTWIVTVFENTLAAEYPNINLTTYDGQESFEVRTELMENVMVQHPDMLILQYFDENEVPMIQEIIDAGIPVVVTNGQYTSAPGLCSFVDISPYEQGATLAKYAAEKHSGECQSSVDSRRGRKPAQCRPGKGVLRLHL